VKSSCARAEILAGAIALGEATPSERDDYRSHIASCAACLAALGGEREIERVMSTVATAREHETWEPAPRRYDARPHRPLWRAAAAAGAIAAIVAIAFVIHAQLTANVRPAVQVAKSELPVVRAQAFHAPIDRRPRSTPQPPVARKVAVHHPSTVVVHNVITRHGNAVTQTTTQTTEIAEAPPVAHISVPASNVPPWRRDEAMPSPKPPATTTPAPVLAGRAESIAVAPLTVVRDVAPLGGDAAISPHLSQFIIAQRAQGTTAFEVHVDERGMPVKCTITKSSGYLSLDDAVCKAAMTARYSPREVNGKPAPGIYRDAFTFRATDDEGTQL
jgi:TonB family protein